MITNISILQIDSKVYTSNLSPQCNINLTVNLKDPKIISQVTSFGNKDFLETDYILSLNYLNPSMGYIIIKGMVYYHQENNELIETKNNWDNEKSSDIKNEIANTLLLNTMPLMMEISQRLRLPPPVPIPQINFAKPQKENVEGYS